MVSDFLHQCPNGCYRSKSFGDGIILVNPAVEANELMQIQELITEKRCFSRSQPKLLHIVSSDKDFANRTLFGIGQFLGVTLIDKEKTLDRNLSIDDKSGYKAVKFSEFQLDTVTAGNYPPFRTGRATKEYIPCHRTNKCLSDKEISRFGFHIATPPFSPMSVIYGDKKFSKDHSDVFNNEIVSYISASIVENKSKKSLSFINALVKKRCIVPKNDKSGRFDFGKCQQYYRDKYQPDLPAEIE